VALCSNSCILLDPFSIATPTDIKYYQPLKGYLNSGKMNVYLKWVIYVEEM